MKKRSAFQGCRVIQRVRNIPALNSGSDGELAFKSSGKVFQCTAPLLLKLLLPYSVWERGTCSLFTESMRLKPESSRQVNLEVR